MRKTGIITVIIVILLSSIVYGNEKKLLNQITKLTYSNNSEAAVRLAREFLKKYPKSGSVPDIHYMIAMNQKSPDNAIKKFKSVISIYRYYKHNDEAALRICEILCLLSRWKELKSESYLALKKYPKSRRNPDFTLLYIHACINMGDYDNAAKECRNFTDRNHEYKSMAKSRLAAAYIDKKTSGLSRKYIYSLRELLIGFEESEVYPSALFLAGSFYQNTSDYNRAYSAFTDLTEKFPGSPEAFYAGKNINELLVHKPEKIPYMPGTKTIDSLDSIDIKPEMSVKKDEKTETFFALSIGPFDNFKRAKEIKKIVSAFGETRMVQFKSGFKLYAGMYSSAEKALQTRIRLAEEEGINARIVRIHCSGSKKYIYGE